ncbi:MAG: hypothetical protein JRF56_05350 [Deltaproteobacteria bacterium]|jgi:hypothetical protein|nr:hypothetical protein [Deltaproteobacteria bacterium]
MPIFGTPTKAKIIDKDMMPAPRKVVTFYSSGILRAKLNRKKATAK